MVSRISEHQQYARTPPLSPVKERGETPYRQLDAFKVSSFPEAPCMVYLPTFTIKINQM